MPEPLGQQTFLYAWCCSSKDCYHSITAEIVTQKKKGAPAPLPYSEEDCPNAPSAPIPGAMRQPVRIVPALDPIFYASRAGQSHKEYTVHEASYRVNLLTFPILDCSEHSCSRSAYLFLAFHLRESCLRLGQPEGHVHG